MRFRYEHFQQKSVTELMKCISIYSDSHGKRCKVCKTYRQWPIWALKEKWFSCYIDFDTTILKLMSTDSQYAFIQHIPLGFSLFLAVPIQPTIQKKKANSSASSNSSSNSNSWQQPNRSNNREINKITQQQQQQPKRFIFKVKYI